MVSDMRTRQKLEAGRQPCGSDWLDTGLVDEKAIAEKIDAAAKLAR